MALDPPHEIRTPPPRFRGDPGEKRIPAAELRELEEQTPVGEIFLGALMRRQLVLSLRVAVTLVVALGAQPLIAWFWPPYGALHVFGIPLPWLVLGVGSYPLMIALGLFYVRHAETIDDEFAELIES
jgi:putative solute:sodium symporter small subunit